MTYAADRGIAETEAKGAVLVVPPDAGEALWQPVPANGQVVVKLAPDLVAMEHPLGLGTQTVPPGCHVRPHLHDRNEEVLAFLSGTGQVVLDGVAHAVVPGTIIFIGRNRTHTIIADGADALTFMWIIVPNGLETFFRAIGRPATPGEPPPAPFPRPPDVLALERQTVFGVLPDQAR